MIRMLLGVWLLLLAPAAWAAAPARPVVVELFTSEGCSSCPPADALLREMAQSPRAVLPLAFHVTYWDSQGWRDPFSLDAATQRQRAYQRTLGSDAIYTPQMVVDGRLDVVGNDRDAVAAAVMKAASEQLAAPAIRLSRDGGQAVVAIGAGSGSARLLLVGYDTEHRTQVGRGENAGRSLLEANIVRGVVSVDNWTGQPATLRAALPPGEHLAALLQSADGHIVGAATE